MKLAFSTPLQPKFRENFPKFRWLVVENSKRNLGASTTKLWSRARPEHGHVFPPGGPLRRGGVFLRRLLRRAGGADKTCGPGRRKLLHPTFCGCAATYVVGLRPISRVLLDPSGSIYFRIFENCHAVHRVHLACSVRQDDNWAGCQANRLGASVAEDNDSRPTRRLGELCTKG